jgi:hypothetical protein
MSGYAHVRNGSPAAFPDGLAPQPVYPRQLPTCCAAEFRLQRANCGLLHCRMAASFDHVGDREQRVGDGQPKCFGAVVKMVSAR